MVNATSSSPGTLIKKGRYACPQRWRGAASGGVSTMRVGSTRASPPTRQAGSEGSQILHPSTFGAAGPTAPPAPPAPPAPAPPPASAPAAPPPDPAGPAPAVGPPPPSS